MDKQRTHIAILEPSAMLYEGLSASILKTEHDYFVYRIDDLNEVEVLHVTKGLSVVLINPVLVQNRASELTRLKNRFVDISWIGIVYSFFEPSFLKLFDDTFLITDSVATVTRKIKNSYRESNSMPEGNEYLSHRETEVLACLVSGKSNKEAAGILHISIHTVSSHRKNIMDKTGIRSLPGLTIYAVSKGILQLD